METSLLLVLMGFAVWTWVCAFIMEKTGMSKYAWTGYWRDDKFRIRAWCVVGYTIMNGTGY